MVLKVFRSAVKYGKVAIDCCLFFYFLQKKKDLNVQSTAVYSYAFVNTL